MPCQIFGIIPSKCFRMHGSISKTTFYIKIQRDILLFLKKKTQSYQLLSETKSLHAKKDHFSKEQLTEFSILFIILNYFEIASKKMAEISEISFASDKNNNLKEMIIDSLNKGESKKDFQNNIGEEYVKLIKEINENSSIQIILSQKNEDNILEFLSELIIEQKELQNLRKIESLEKELINNLDENSYSELVKLKSQINGE